MIQHSLSPAASRDIATILERSEMNFGQRASRRYEELIVRAISDLIDNPHRSGCVDTPEVKLGSFIYHLKHSRRNVRKDIGRVHQPDTSSFVVSKKKACWRYRGLSMT